MDVYTFIIRLTNNINDNKSQKARLDSFEIMTHKDVTSNLKSSENNHNLILVQEHTFHFGHYFISPTMINKAILFTPSKRKYYMPSKYGTT